MQTISQELAQAPLDDIEKVRPFEGSSILGELLTVFEGRVTTIRNPKPVLIELPEALSVICPHSPLIGTIGKVRKKFSLRRKIFQKPR